MRKLLVISIISMLSFLTITYVLDKPIIGDDSISYYFTEATEFSPKNWIDFGIEIMYINGHVSNGVEIAMNNFGDIESLEVFVEGETLIILIEDDFKTSKKDRLFSSNKINGIYSVMDNIKVYRNGKRYYFVRSVMAVE